METLVGVTHGSSRDECEDNAMAAGEQYFGVALSDLTVRFRNVTVQTTPVPTMTDPNGEAVSGFEAEYEVSVS